MTDETQAAPKAVDPTRPMTCAHGFKATPKPVHTAFRGPGYWQNFAKGCTSCNGAPAGIPYKPHPPPESKR